MLSAIDVWLRPSSGRFNPWFLISCAFLLVVVGSCELALAQSGTQATRPKIGLAVGGGGARGAAHIGVLKVLEELRIPVDYVAGTSMGAIVGGLYASGHSPEEIEQILESIDWDRVVSDRPPRQALTFRRKQEDFELLVKFEAGFREGKFRLPEALISGAALDSTLRWYALRARNITDFDKLAIPFRAVAADLETGEMVALDHGNLGVAMRASSSIPGVFAPVEVDGRELVDGGIVRNLPVDVVRGMGADIVIVVDVGTLLQDVEETANFLGVTRQILRMQTRKNADEQIKQLRDGDVLIQPELGDIASMEFARAGEAVSHGEIAARKAATALARYTVSEADYRAFVERQRVEMPEPPRLAYIQINSDSRVDQQVIKRRLKMRPGDVLDRQALQDDLERVYGMGYFEYVSFELVEGLVKDEERMGLIIEARTKSWGPSFLRAGLNLEDNLEGNNRYNLGLDFTATQLNRRGAEWKTLLSLGNLRGIRSEFYQPVDFSGRWFVAPRIQFRRDLSDIFLNGDKVAEVDTRERSVGFDVGLNLGRTCCEARLGVERGDIKADVEVGAFIPSSIDSDLGGYTGTFLYDMVDGVAFPRHGSFGALRFFLARDNVGSDLEYDKSEVSWLTAGSFGEHTLLGGFSYGSSGSSTLPIFDQFTMGGFLNLSGLQPNELRGQYRGQLTLIYYRQIKRSLLGNALYVGGSLEAGNVWQQRDDIFDDNIGAGSLFLGADTTFGPLYLAYGIAEGGRDTFYLFLGQGFRRRF